MHFQCHSGHVQRVPRLPVVTICFIVARACFQKEIMCHVTRSTQLNCNTAQHCTALGVSSSCKQFEHALQGSDSSQKVAGVDAEGSAGHTSQEHGSELDQLSHTQAALKQAMQQLDVLTSSDDDMHSVRTQLQQQTQALQSMQESIATAEEEKARDREQALSRSISDHMHGRLHAGNVFALAHRSHLADVQQAPAVHRVAQPLQTTDCTNCPPSNSPATLTCPDRFQELEEALTLAEEQLSKDQEQSADDLRQQLKQLQADLQSKAASAEQLEQELQNKEAARQQAADELSVALEQQISVQVSQASFMPPLPQPLDLMLGRCFATACPELATCMQYGPSVQPQSLIMAQSNLSIALLHPTCQMHYVTQHLNAFKKEVELPIRLFKSVHAVVDRIRLRPSFRTAYPSSNRSCSSTRTTGISFSQKPSSSCRVKKKLQQTLTSNCRMPSSSCSSSSTICSSLLRT